MADEYAAVSAKIDALYGQPQALPADYETTGMARLRREAHARLLGNGLCTRPAELDCRLESACETCAYFRTSTEFRPVLIRQRDHARNHGQADRADLFGKIIQNVEQRLDNDHPYNAESAWLARSLSMTLACTQISRFWAGLGSTESSQLLAGQRGWNLSSASAS